MPVNNNNNNNNNNVFTSTHFTEEKNSPAFKIARVVMRNENKTNFTAARIFSAICMAVSMRRRV